MHALNSDRMPRLIARKKVCCVALHRRRNDHKPTGGKVSIEPVIILGYLELCMRVYVASESDPYGTGTSSSIGHFCPRVEIVRVPRLSGDFDLFGASQTSSPCCGERSLTV